MPETSVPTATEKVRKNDTVVLKMRVSKAADGLHLYFQSDVLEGLMKNLANGETSTGSTNAVFQRACYRLALPSGFVLTPLGRVDRWGYNELYVGGTSQVNMSFLRTVGLQEGVEFILTGVVFSQEQVRDFVRDIKMAVTDVYRRHMTPLDISIELIAQEVRK